MSDKRDAVADGLKRHKVGAALPNPYHKRDAVAETLEKVRAHMTWPPWWVWSPFALVILLLWWIR